MFLAVAADQLSKFIIKNALVPGQSMPVIRDIFHLTYITNTGATWGLFKNNNTLFIFISLIAIGLFFYYYDKLPKPRLVNAVILGGILGNLIDRIFLGAVVDFLDFRVWPVFNIADSCISVGVIVLLIFMIKEK